MSCGICAIWKSVDRAAKSHAARPLARRRLVRNPAGEVDLDSADLGAGPGLHGSPCACAAALGYHVVVYTIGELPSVRISDAASSGRPVGDAIT